METSGGPRALARESSSQEAVDTGVCDVTQPRLMRAGRVNYRESGLCGPLLVMQANKVTLLLTQTPSSLPPNGPAGRNALLGARFPGTDVTAAAREGAYEKEYQEIGESPSVGEGLLPSTQIKQNLQPAVRRRQAAPCAWGRGWVPNPLS